MLLNYWRKRFSVTLQTFNARLITQAFLVIFDNGGGNFEHDLFLLEHLKCCRLKFLTQSLIELLFIIKASLYHVIMCGTDT